MLSELTAWLSKKKSNLWYLLCSLVTNKVYRLLLLVTSYINIIHFLWICLQNFLLISKHCTCHFRFNNICLKFWIFVLIIFRPTIYIIIMVLHGMASTILLPKQLSRTSQLAGVIMWCFMNCCFNKTEQNRWQIGIQKIKH